MHTPQLVSVLVATGTWVGFGITMKSYFRCAEQRTRAKTWLIFSAFLCTVTQIVSLCEVKTPGPIWFWAGMSAYAMANALFWWAL